ncbi:MAG: heavy-metal-associated domain-containing protein [Planctomycetes bacterium]|jgi:copper chaperone CopZ|nr:heavy-metal-associated domain-containing protein [Planctomycetota bacterium]
MATVLKVEKMHCQSCAKRVTNAIMGVAPHSKIDIDIDGRRVTIDGISNLAEVTKALEDAGYPAQNA